MAVLITVLVLLLIFGVLVGIHEFGHFIAAKRQGVWVQEFAFGFGPTIFSKKYGETIYKINLVPLGGYVKLYGESPLKYSKNLKRDFENLDDEYEDKIKGLSKEYHLNKILDDDKLRLKINSLPGVEDKDKDWLWTYEMNKESRINNDRRYSNKPIWRRMIIVCAGVTMNFILGILLYVLYLGVVSNQVLIPNMSEYNFLSANVSELEAPIIQHVYDDEHKGLMGSVIIAVDDVTSTKYEETYASIEENYGKSINVKYFKDGKILTENIVLDGEGYGTSLDIELRDKVVLTEIVLDSPAEKAGLLIGDIILKINNEDVISQEQFIEALDEYKGQEVSFEVVRPGEGAVEVTVVLLDPEDDSQPKLGAHFRENSVFATGAYLLEYPNSFIGGAAHSINMMGYQVAAISDIFRYAIENRDAEIVANTVSGPIGVGAEVKNLVEVGNFIDILNIAALISLTLAIMNILPLPVTDGGHVVLLAVEKVRGEPLPEKAQQIYNLIGIVAIIFLSLVVTAKDIFKLFV